MSSESTHLIALPAHVTAWPIAAGNRDFTIINTRKRKLIQTWSMAISMKGRILFFSNQKPTRLGWRPTLYMSSESTHLGFTITTLVTAWPSEATTREFLLANNSWKANFTRSMYKLLMNAIPKTNTCAAITEIHTRRCSWIRDISLSRLCCSCSLYWVLPPGLAVKARPWCQTECVRQSSRHSWRTQEGPEKLSNVHNRCTCRIYVLREIIIYSIEMKLMILTYERLTQKSLTKM